MEFKNFPPSDILKRFVKYYWVCTTDEDVSMEVMFPSGYVEFCIDISSGNTIRHRGDQSVKMPRLEVLGHLTVPTTATVAKDTTVLVTRFYPYAFPLFFPNPVADFTNSSVDLCDILGHESVELYDCLMEQHSLENKIEVLEAFLIQRLMKGDKKNERLKLIEHLCSHIYNNEFFSLKNLTLQCGFTERYIQKLFLNWIGLTPKSFHSVLRFNKSLELMQSSDASLTSIAHECGYYDQAHFIKEFKSHAGIAPLQAAKLF